MHAMAVVINDFEVAAEPAPAPQTSSSRPKAGTTAQTPSARELEQMMRERYERCLRTRAG
jgi:hypothetical protein